MMEPSLFAGRVRAAEAYDDLRPSLFSICPARRLRLRLRRECPHRRQERGQLPPARDARTRHVQEHKPRFEASELDTADGVVQTIRSIINPEKLRHLGPLADVRAPMQQRAGDSR